MSSTNFVDYQTPINASWLNDVDAAIYEGAGVFTPAGTGAVATTVQTKGRQTVDIFDAVSDAEKAALAAGTSTLDYSAPLVTLLTLGMEIHFSSPGTYKFNTAITNTNRLKITGVPGVKWDVSGTTAANFLTHNGTLTAIPDLSVSPSEGATTLTFASAPGVVQGDVIILYNPTDSSYATWTGRAYYRDGEMVEVLSISGSVVTIKEPLRATYTAASMDCYRMNSVDFEMSGIEIIGAAQPTGLVKVTCCKNPQFNNIKASHANNSIIVFDRCFSPVINEPLFNNTGDGGDDYGIVLSNTSHARGYGGRVYSRRHAWTNGGDDVVGCVPSRDNISSRMTLISGTTAGAFDTHGNAEDCYAKDCHIIGGVDLGGKNNMVFGGSISAQSQGILCYMYEVKGGRMGIDVDSVKVFVDPDAVTRGLIDVGGNGDAVTASTTSALTVVAKTKKIKGRNLSSNTIFTKFVNRGATVAVNFDVSPGEMDVNLLGNALLTNLVTGTADSDFVVVDGIRNGPTSMNLHNASGAHYRDFPHRCQRQTGVYSDTTTVTTAIIAAAISFRYVYPRIPNETVGLRGAAGATMSSLAGQAIVNNRAFDVSESSIRPYVSAAANFTAGTAYEQPWSVELAEC